MGAECTSRVRAAAVIAASAFAGAFTLALTIAPLLWERTAQAAEPPPPQAPAFSLPDADGTPVTLASYRSRPVLLVFYRGFW
ncbi:MAG: hypothetical protein ABIT01_18550 [Thermoanaerobaculia bacterium]